MKVYGEIMGLVAVSAVAATGYYYIIGGGGSDGGAPDGNLDATVFLFLCLSATMTAVVLAYAMHVGRMMGGEYSRAAV